MNEQAIVESIKLYLRTDDELASKVSDLLANADTAKSIAEKQAEATRAVATYPAPEGSLMERNPNVRPIQFWEMLREALEDLGREVIN